MVGFLARGNHPVVTRGTTAAHFVVVYANHRCPGVFAVAGFADGAGVNVTRTPTFGNSAVVTGETGR